jgi:uncharacterized protein (TIGR02996 family)
MTKARAALLALIRGCKEAPADDAPRLVLADWLQETGDEHDHARGELIRLQCRRARLAEDDPQARELHDREGQLKRRHGARWPSLLTGKVGPGVLRRGLLDLRCEGRRLATKAAFALAGTEALAWVDGMHLGSLTDKTLPKIAAAGLLDGLNRLSLRHRPIRAAGAEALAKRDLSLLTDLDLHQCWIEPRGATALARLDLPRLARLDLAQNMIHSTGVRALASWPALAAVEELNLRTNRFESRGIDALVASPHLRRLKVLHLGNCFIGDAGAAALAEWPALTGVEELEFFFSQMTDEGAEALAASPYLRRVRLLDLGGNHFTERGRAALRERFGDAVRV